MAPKIDGAGNFKSEDVLVPGSGFFTGRVERRAVACGAFRPLGPLKRAAIALYEKLGYVRIPNYGMYEGKEVCLCYEKSLAGARP